MEISLPILNLHDAKFECIYGRGCSGLCCQNGRPGVFPDEQERIEANLEKFLPLLRAKAQTVVGADGFVSRRTKDGLPMLRVVEGWCVFFNEGCVLHKVGAKEGKRYHYKPSACALFPLSKDEQDRWYIRQKNYKGEAWDLFCLDPAASPMPAAVSLQEEIELAERIDAECQALEQAASPVPASKSTKKKAAK